MSLQKSTLCGAPCRIILGMQFSNNKSKNDAPKVGWNINCVKAEPLAANLFFFAQMSVAAMSFTVFQSSDRLHKVWQPGKFNLRRTVRPASYQFPYKWSRKIICYKVNGDWSVVSRCALLTIHHSPLTKGNCAMGCNFIQWNPHHLPYSPGT
jgi:hypothetical protein